MPIRPQDETSAAAAGKVRATHGDIVIDAFSGSGTTIIAAQLTGRIGYAIELEPKYVNVAIRRFEEMFGTRAVLEGTGQTVAELKAAREAEMLASAA